MRPTSFADNAILSQVVLTSFISNWYTALERIAAKDDIRIDLVIERYLYRGLKDDAKRIIDEEAKQEEEGTE